MSGRHSAASDRRQPPGGARADVDEPAAALEAVDDRVDRCGKGPAASRTAAGDGRILTVDQLDELSRRPQVQVCMSTRPLCNRLDSCVHGTSLVPVREGYNQLVLTTSDRTVTIRCGVHGIRRNE